MGRRTLSLLGCLLLAGGAVTAAARQLAVKAIPYEERIEVGGRRLKLVGAGLREKWFFDVYTMGAYSESGVCQAEALVSADEAKSLRFHMLRDVPAERMASALEKALKKNTPRDAPEELRARIRSFVALFQRDLAQGDRMELTYLPGVGVLLTQNGQEQGPATPGKAFADILWSCYFGSKTCCEGLKEQILSSCSGQR